MKYFTARRKKPHINTNTVNQNSAKKTATKTKLKNVQQHY